MIRDGFLWHLYHVYIWFLGFSLNEAFTGCSRGVLLILEVFGSLGPFGAWLAAAGWLDGWMAFLLRSRALCIDFIYIGC